MSAIAAWAARSSDSIQPELLSLFASGLKEKETLRRGHLRCLRVISKNSDVIARVGKLNFMDFLDSFHLLLSFLIWNSCNCSFLVENQLADIRPFSASYPTSENWFYKSSAAFGWNICFAFSWKDYGSRY